MKRVLIVAAFLIAMPAVAQDDDGGTSLGSLLNGLKDLKVPETVTDLPKQITDLKDAYIDTARTVEQLQLEVSALREELAALRSDNEELKRAVGDKVAVNKLEAMQQPVSVSADDLAAAYAKDRTAADEKYKDRYLKVIGSVEKFESGVQEVIIALRTEDGPSVKCHIKRDAAFHVEVIPVQGRLVDRNDRSTLLAVGQPVAILGTCNGTSLDIHLLNCRIDGLEVKKIETPAPKK